MKKFACLCIGILLFGIMGCGGGGGTTTTAIAPGGDGGGGTGGGGETFTGPVGFITVSILSPSGPTTKVPLSTGGQTAINSLRDHFRVVVKQVADFTYLDEENNPFTVRTEVRRIVLDNTIPGTLQIAVPPGIDNDYTVEVLTYQQNGLTYKKLLQYGKSAPFSVRSGVTTPVELTLIPIAQYITMTAPSNVVSGFAYNISIDKTVPLRSQYYLSQTDNISAWPISDFVAGYGPTGTQRTSGSVSFTAPTVAAQSNLYLQGQFFIDDSLLSAQELLPATPPTWSNWRINCPDPAYTEAVTSILLLPGSIDVIIN